MLITSIQDEDALSALPEISIPVSVQAFQKPDINCLVTARGRLLFPYVTPPGTADTISVWLSENDGAWIRQEDGVDVGTDMLSLSTFLLLSGFLADHHSAKSNLPAGIFACCNQ